MSVEDEDDEDDDEDDSNSTKCGNLPLITTEIH